METAIISGKGGTGKSSVTAAIASLMDKVVLADCDVDAANLYLLFEPEVEEDIVFVGGTKAVVDPERCTGCLECVSLCRFDAISEKPEGVVISDFACDGCGLCSKACPWDAITLVDQDKSRLYSGSFRQGRMIFGRLAPGEENSGRLVNLVRDKAKKMAELHSVRHVLIDGPPGIGCPVISSITGVDQVLIVTEPSVSGLHDLQRAAELTSSFGIITKVLINKADLNTDNVDMIEKYCTSENIPVIGKLPFDMRVVEAMANCKSMIEYAPGSVFSNAMVKVFNILFN